MPVEGESVGKLFAAHDLEAHGVGERECLIPKSKKPVESGGLHQVGRHSHPGVQPIGCYDCKRFTRAPRAQPAKEVRVKLGQHERCPDVTNAGRTMLPGKINCARMVLVAGIVNGQ